MIGNDVLNCFFICGFCDSFCVTGLIYFSVCNHEIQESNVIFTSWTNRVRIDSVLFEMNESLLFNIL